MKIKNFNELKTPVILMFQSSNYTECKISGQRGPLIANYTNSGSHMHVQCFMISVQFEDQQEAQLASIAHLDFAI